VRRCIGHEQHAIGYAVGLALQRVVGCPNAQLRLQWKR
jgi:hypothetical protein